MLTNQKGSTTVDIFVYQNEPPQVLPEMTKTSKCLCQRYNNKYHFATLYDTAMKIPVYSAYKIEFFLRPDYDDGKRNYRTAGNVIGLKTSYGDPPMRP